MKDKLKEYGLKVGESDNPDRKPIDFEIYDEDDNVCWVWGEMPDNVDFECDHPYECIEWGDDDEVGVCALCGATCEWHYESDDEGHQIRTPHSWNMPDKPGGIIGEYLEELKGK